MTYRIGGEFEITLSDFLNNKIDQPPICYGKTNHLVVDTGRSALLLALQSILQNGGKQEAWLPRFCCDSVILPFKQLGFKINFYTMGADLQSPDKLPSSLDKVTILFINYFGKENRSFKKMFQTLYGRDNDSIFIIEDNVQSSLCNFVDDISDYRIYSFRKLLAQPDGALLAYNHKFNYELNESNEMFVSNKLIGKIIRGEGGSPKDFLDLFSESETSVDVRISPRRISSLSKFMFERVDLVEISNKRIQNWNYLLELLDSEKLLKRFIFPIYNSLNEGEVPLGLPVTLDQRHRDRLRSFLMENQIFCPVHWPIKETKYSKWDKEIILSSSILTLPIDQRLDFASLEYFVETITAFFRRI